MSQAELLALIVSVFNELGIEYMLVGSHASSFYGEARSTHDVDLVVDLDEAKIPTLVASFDSQRYYLSETALREGRMANLIDTQTGDKVDCFLLGSDPAQQIAFGRRRLETVMGVRIPLASAEDTILSKISWSNSVGGSTRQLQDVREIIRNQSDSIDLKYIHAQADRMNIGTEVQELLTDGA